MCLEGHFLDMSLCKYGIIQFKAWHVNSVYFKNGRKVVY